MCGRATITLGIGPHSSLLLILHGVVNERILEIGQYLAKLGTKV